MLAALLSVALAGGLDWNDSLEHLRADPEPCGLAWEPDELRPFCPGADAAFQEIFVEGRLGPVGSLGSWLGLIRALSAGERRVRVAPDRGAVDADAAGALATLDRLVARGSDFAVLSIAVQGTNRLLDSYAALPGPTGPEMAAALVRPPPADVDLAHSLLQTCEGHVTRAVAASFPDLMTPLWGAWQLSTVGQVLHLPWFVHTEDLTRRTRRHCVASVGAALAGRPVAREPAAPWRHRGSEHVLDSLLGGLEENAVLPHLRAELRAHEDRRVSLAP
jgi:hypothetical protein